MPEFRFKCVGKSELILESGKRAHYIHLDGDLINESVEIHPNDLQMFNIGEEIAVSIRPVHVPCLT